jgi:hypothetical protein
VTGRGWREDVARRSAPAAILLARQPKWLVVVAVALVVIGGLALPGAPGAALLLVVAAVLAWLVLLRWDHAPPAGRAARLIVAVAVLAYALSKLL